MKQILKDKPKIFTKQIKRGNEEKKK